LSLNDDESGKIFLKAAHVRSEHETPGTCSPYEFGDDSEFAGAAQLVFKLDFNLNTLALAFKF
jgi:hypothetical protein